MATRDFSIHVDIQAPPDRIWSIMRDVERWHEWTPSITSVRLLSQPFAVGARALVRQPKLPPALWQVAELDDRARSFTWISRGPGMRVAGRHWVEPRGDGSRAHLALEYRGPLGGLLAWLTRGVNDRYLAMEAEGLKWRSEEPQRLDAAGRAKYALR